MQPLSEFEHQCLVALVLEYGAEHIVEIVREIGQVLAEESYENAAESP